MAYSASKHQVFSQRCLAYCLALANLREEAQRLTAVYQNESAYGNDAAFADTDLATEQEHIDLIVAMAEIETTLAAQWSNITPFLANQPQA